MLCLNDKTSLALGCKRLWRTVRDRLNWDFFSFKFFNFTKVSCLFTSKKIDLDESQQSIGIYYSISEIHHDIGLKLARSGRKQKLWWNYSWNVEESKWNDELICFFVIQKSFSSFYKDHCLFISFWYRSLLTLDFFVKQVFI